MSDTKQVQSGGVSVLGLLGVLFVGLKLTGIITWSWWWVTAPFWGGLALVLAILLGMGLFVVGAVLVAHLLERSKRKSVNQWRR